MIADMIRSAGPDGDERRITSFVYQVREVVGELERNGLELDRSDSGSLKLTSAGGMSEPRVATSGDRIGGPVMKVLIRELRNSQCTIRPNCRVRAIHRLRDGLSVETDTEVLRARSVVVATGGTSYRESRRTSSATSNPSNENHHLYDMLSLSLGVQAERHYQFQPFGDVASIDSSHVAQLVPESVVSLDVQLLDRNGKAVVDVRAGRLVVSQAIWEAERNNRTVEASNGRQGLLLTLSGIDPGVLEARFPTLYQKLVASDRVGTDLVVAPVLHYELGGLVAGSSGRTAVEGLYIAGEMVGGLHGANRLMGNGLTESLVSGWRTGREVVDYVNGVA